MPIIDQQIKRAIRMAGLVRSVQEGDELSASEKEEIREFERETNFAINEEMKSREMLVANVKEVEKFADKNRIAHLIAMTAAKPLPEKMVTDRRPTGRWWLYAAVIVPLIVTAAIWWMIGTRDAQPVDPIVITSTPSPAKANAVLNIGNTGDLLISPGKEITLSSQQDVSIKNSPDGILVYSAAAAEQEGVYHTLQTTRGGYYSIQLSDGTRAWLNSSSSISYPVTFAAENRIVRVSGEVYFEVAANARAPFVVRIENGYDLTVLGTRFVVAAFPTSDPVKTTLLEGSVALTDPATKKMMRIAPGQQAVYDGEFRITSVDTMAAVAWARGVFYFQHRSFQECMRDIGAWYNVDIIYESDVPDVKLWGEIDRRMPFARLLDYLKTAGVRYRYENDRKLIILR